MGRLHGHWSWITAAGICLGIAAAIVGSASDAGAAPNRVANGDFAIDASGWTATTPTTTLQFAPGPADDAGDSASSGSGQVDWTDAVPSGASIIESNCFALGPAAVGSYDLAASSKLVGTNDPATEAWVSIVLYDGLNCTGTSSTASAASNTSNNDTWQLHFVTGISVVATHLSGRVQLVLSPNAGGERGWFDNVSFSNGTVDTPTPTNTPVATDTPTPTNTALPTNTPLPTDTPAPTNTVEPTNTPIPTNTPPPTAIPVPTDTPVPPPPPTQAPAVVGPPPASSLDPSGGSAGAGSAPEEAPEGAEAPESTTDELPEGGYGPQPHDESNVTEAVAWFMFAAALGLMALGLRLQRVAVRDDDE